MAKKFLNERTPFNLRVQKGEVAGHSVIDKFGSNDVITTSTDPEDIWEYGGLYNFTANAGTLYYISSSNNSDTIECLFFVLTVDSDGNWNKETITQSIVGQTKTLLVTPSGDPIVRIYRISNNDSSDLVGTLYVYENDTTTTPGVPDTAAKVRAIMNNGNNQTLMCIYTIPSGYVGYLYRGEAGLTFTAGPSATDYAKLEYRSRRFGKTFNIKKEIGLITTGESVYKDERSFPDPIPAKTDIVLRCCEVSADMGVWGTFDIMLVEEEYLTDDYLAAIGQIKRVV
jgi:hypothetical protein